MVAAANLVGQSDARLKIGAVWFIRRPAIAIHSRKDQSAFQLESRNLERTRGRGIEPDVLIVEALGHRRLIVPPKAKVERQAPDHLPIILDEAGVVEILPRAGGADVHAARGGR